MVVLDLMVKLLGCGYIIIIFPENMECLYKQFKNINQYVGDHFLFLKQDLLLHTTLRQHIYLVANYIAKLCPNLIRLVLVELLKEALPKQQEVWVIDRKAVATSQRIVVPET